MKTKAVYQTDQRGFFLYESEAHELALAPGYFNIPNGAYELKPPATGAGMVARWLEDGWSLVEDHRSDILYYIKTPATEETPALIEQYVIGTEATADGELVSYDGGGPIPAWLTDVAPAAPAVPALEQ